MVLLFTFENAGVFLCIVGESGKTRQTGFPGWVHPTYPQLVRRYHNRLCTHHRFTAFKNVGPYKILMDCVQNFVDLLWKFSVDFGNVLFADLSVANLLFHVLSCGEISGKQE